MLKTSPLPVKEYNLEGVDEDAAVRVMEFCYTSAISVPEDSLRSIFVAAAKLGVKDVVDLCCEMLTSSLDIATCVQTHLLAVSLDCGDLVTTTGAFFLEHINQLCVSDTFLGLSSKEMWQFVASLLRLDVEDMQLFQCTKAWFDHVTEDRHILALQFIDEFPALANSLKKYHDLDWPSVSPHTMLTYSRGVSDILDQKSDSKAISRQHTTVSLAQDVTNRQHNQPNEVQGDVCVSCGQYRDDQCQPTPHVQDKRETINPGQTITGECTNQSEGRLCVSGARLAVECPVVNCQLDDGCSECCSHVIGGRELEPGKGSHNPDINIQRQVTGLHYCNHLQKCPQRYLSKKALNCNQKNVGCTAKMEHNLPIRQPATVNKVQPISGRLQVNKSDLLQRLEKTTNRQYDTSQRTNSNNISSPGNIDKPQLFPTVQHTSSVPHKRSIHSSSITQPSSQRGASNYSLRETDYKCHGVDSNSNGMDSNSNGVDSNSNGIDSRINTDESNSCHVAPISNVIHDNSNATESNHNCVDRRCSSMECPNDSLVAGEFTFNKYCHQKDMNSKGHVSVQQQVNIRAPASRKYTGSYNQQEEIVGKSLGNDLSNAKRQTGTLAGAKLQLLKCTICHWAFKERAQLVKHRQDVHGFANERLQEGGFSISGENAGVTDGRNQKIQTVGDIVEHHEHNCNLEKNVAENRCRSSFTPSPACEPSRAVTDNNHPYSSTQGDHGKNTAPTGLCSTSSIFSPRQSFHWCELCNRKVMTSAYSENCRLRFQDSTTMGRQTASNNTSNTIMPLDMSNGSTTLLSELSTIHHGPLDLSISCIDKNHSAIDGCDRGGAFSNNSIADSVAQGLSADNNLGLVYDLPPGYSAALSGCIAATLRLPAACPQNDVSENKRELCTTCIHPPASVNCIPTSCTEESNNSMSVKQTATSHHSLPSGALKGMVAYPTAWLTHTQTNCQSAATYQCHICQQKFTCTRDLNLHLCPHGTNKPYTCPHCSHTFAKTIHLKRHLVTHSGLKPYPCWICGKRFSRSDHLKRHTQSLHAGSKPHGCHLCGKEFVRKYELSKHMTSHSVYMNA